MRANAALVPQPLCSRDAIANAVARAADSTAEAADATAAPAAPRERANDANKSAAHHDIELAQNMLLLHTHADGVGGKSASVEPRPLQRQSALERLVRHRDALLALLAARGSSVATILLQDDQKACE